MPHSSVCMCTTAPGVARRLCRSSRYAAAEQREAASGTVRKGWAGTAGAAGAAGTAEAAEAAEPAEPAEAQQLGAVLRPLTTAACASSSQDPRLVEVHAAPASRVQRAKVGSDQAKRPAVAVIAITDCQVNWPIPAGRAAVLQRNHLLALVVLSAGLCSSGACRSVCVRVGWSSCERRWDCVSAPRWGARSLLWRRRNGSRMTLTSLFGSLQGMT